jgi:hypothetical protein
MNCRSWILCERSRRSHPARAHGSDELIDLLDDRLALDNPSAVLAEAPAIRRNADQPDRVPDRPRSVPNYTISLPLLPLPRRWLIALITKATA